LISARKIIQAPAGKPADIFILKYAKLRDCYILSNDLFRDYKLDFGEEWIREKRVTFVFIDDTFIFT